MTGTHHGTEYGGWVVYSFDNGEYAISLHASAADAARSAARCGYGSVAWWPFGTDLDVAIHEWVKPRDEEAS